MSLVKPPAPQRFIFISHVHEEASLAGVLKETLQAAFRYVEVFVSGDDIKAGTPFMERITKELQGADVFLVLCSRRSIARSWVLFEIGGARLLGKPVIPVCHSGLEFAELPVFVSDLQAVSLDKGLETLLEGTSKRVGLQAVDVSHLQAKLRKALEESRPGDDASSYQRLTDARERIKEIVTRRSGPHTVKILAATGSSFVELVDAMRKAGGHGGIDVEIQLVNPASPLINAMPEHWKTEGKQTLRRLRGISNVTVTARLIDHIPCVHGLMIDGEHLFLGFCEWGAKGQRELWGTPAPHTYYPRRAEYEKHFGLFEAWFQRAPSKVHRVGRQRQAPKGP